MMRSKYRLMLGAIVALNCGRVGDDVQAKDVFVTIGGGYSPAGNQVSLEKNVAFLQNVLAEKRPDRPRHEIYFADGNDAERDVHFRDPDFEKNTPPARRMMAEIFGDASEMDFVYRNHVIAGLTGPAYKSLLEERFHELSQELGAGDRLIVYATGHGGPAVRGGRGRGGGGQRRGRGRGRGNPYNTTLLLWDEEVVTASEFSGWLSDLRPDVQVVLIMVQCHSGGFSHTIFEQASASLGLAPHARCGFFSQVYDRVAAGCTPDVDEADYQEYSSFFWAALSGKTRAGAALGGIDYDKNGTVSFAEAHAYAVLASDTIDIPLRTSDAFLREYSRAEGSSAGTPPAEPTGFRRGRRGRGPVEEQPENQPTAQPAATPRPVEGLMPLTGAISRLAGIARPEQRAILEQLPARIGLREGATVEDIRRRLETAQTDIAAATARHTETANEKDDALETVRSDLRRVWPELNSTYAPVAVALASERASEFVAKVSALASYREFRAASEAEAKAAEAELDADRMEAKVQRLLRTCEEIVLTANLAKVATPEILARYEQLVALESGTLSAPK